MSLDPEQPDQPEDLLRELRHAVVPVDGPQGSARRRERTISHMKALQTESRSRKTRHAKWRKRLLVAAAVLIPSAALAATWATLHPASVARAPVAVAPAAVAPVTVAPVAPRLRVLHGAVTLLHADGATVREGTGTNSIAFATTDRLETDGDAEASVDLPSGASFVVSSATELGIDTDGVRLERIELASGGVDVRVPKLLPGRHLVVRTKDSTVTVHGTRFTVEAVETEGGANAYTRVIVREGVVAVEHDGRTTELFAGDRWSSASEERREVGAEAHTPVSVAAHAPRVATPRSIARATPSPATTSTLAVENALMQRALMASRQGDDARAVVLFDDLIARYPHSPLEPNAEVERFRALQRLGKVTQAAKQARRYLGEHPDGMGSDEARRIAVEPIAPAANGGAERAR